MVSRSRLSFQYADFMKTYECFHEKEYCAKINDIAVTWCSYMTIEMLTAFVINAARIFQVNQGLNFLL
jgi:hypothetical protein